VGRESLLEIYREGAMTQHMKYCWYPDETNVYGIAEIINESGDEFSVQPVSAENLTPTASRPFSVKSKSTFIVDSTEELLLPPSDLIQLIDVHRPGILHTLKHRFQQDKIYTSVGPILIALNPFRWISGLYEEDIRMKYYNGLSNLSENPHVFAMAHDALTGLQFEKNQSLIISGESGAVRLFKLCIQPKLYFAGQN
jgi:myosin V